MTNRRRFVKTNSPVDVFPFDFLRERCRHYTQLATFATPSAIKPFALDFFVFSTVGPFYVEKVNFAYTPKGLIPRADRKTLNFHKRGN
jgi:hypothetical protein